MREDKVQWTKEETPRERELRLIAKGFQKLCKEAPHAFSMMEMSTCPEDDAVLHKWEDRYSKLRKRLREEIKRA